VEVSISSFLTAVFLFIRRDSPKDATLLAIYDVLLLLDLLDNGRLEEAAVQPRLVENVRRAGEKQSVARADHRSNKQRRIGRAPVEFD